MKLFSYVLVHDTGFAPNPFGGYCTLACCKPTIRRRAEPGDWVLGLSRRSLGNRLIYAMLVQEKLTFREYWQDSRFAAKKPNMRSVTRLDHVGDNIYEPTGASGYRQLPSFHSSRFAEDPAMKKRDLSGHSVLVSNDYFYFGRAPIPLPASFADLRVTRGYKSRFPPTMVSEVDAWLRTLKPCTTSRPTIWPDGEDSWKASSGCGR